MKTCRSVNSFLGTQNTMANQGVTCLQQTRFLSAIFRKLFEIMRNQLSEFLMLVFAHIMAVILSSTVDETNHLQVHVGTPGSENVRIVRIDVIIPLFSFQNVESSFLTDIPVTFQVSSIHSLWEIKATSESALFSTRLGISVSLYSQSQFIMSRVRYMLCIC